MSDKVILLNSNEVIDVNPKLLNSDDVQYGEVGVNYHKDVETISTKNDNNVIAEFVPYTVYEEKINEVANEVFYEIDEPSGKTGDVWIYKIPPKPLQLEYTTTTANETVRLPLYGDVNVTVDWGDGSTIQTVTSNNPTHEYSSIGAYTVQITGDFRQIFSGSTNITKVLDWGDSNALLNNLNNAFNGCVNLTEVVNDEYGLFVNVTSCERMFAGCTGLSSIPDKLFKYCSKSLRFRTTFYNCISLTSIPEGLFDECVSAIDFHSVFENCTNISSAIPDGLFDNCPDVLYFGNAFYGCSKLTGSIPNGLFKNKTLATEFSSIFRNCPSLTGSIPEDLFKNCVKANTINETFQNCSGLTGAIPNDLFDNNKNVTTFASTFQNCSGLTGTTPTGADNLELWERAGQPGYPTTITGTTCYRNCTNLTNYSSIPATWK